jgi:transcriptional regulator with XRE-family HTH domain
MTKISRAMRKRMLGDNIKHFRKGHELSQEKLGLWCWPELEGKLAGARISSYELGKRFPELENLIRIATVLDVGLDDLVDRRW